MSSAVTRILHRAVDGERLTFDEGVALFECRDLMALERPQGIDVLCNRTERWTFGPCRVRYDCCESCAALGESPVPRMRFAAPFPDRARHSRCPNSRIYRWSCEPPASRNGTTVCLLRGPARESSHFTPNRNLGVCVQIVNGRMTDDG